MDLKGVDQKVVDKASQSEYFAKTRRSEDKKGEEAFFKQGEKPEVRLKFPCLNNNRSDAVANVKTEKASCQ